MNNIGIQIVVFIISTLIAMIMAVLKITNISINNNQKKLSIKKEFLKTKGLSSNSKKLVKENIEILCFQNETGMYEKDLSFRIALRKLYTNFPKINWNILKSIKRFLVFQNNQIMINNPSYYSHILLTIFILLQYIGLLSLFLFNPINNLIIIFNDLPKFLSFFCFYIIINLFISILIVPIMFVEQVRPKLKKL